ncbi:YqeB family protein [Plantactinospora sp. CA-290183]|uniref:YqeB family protein n=1 Tax=Plantactinospora sp. CA-290183 TaxID=3240006 RepID=UPI003D8FC754
MPTVVAERRLVVAGVWLLFPLIGAAAGGLLRWSVEWLDWVRWKPVRGVVRLVESFDEPWATAGALLLGALAGLAVAVIAAVERLTVTIGDDGVRLARSGTGRYVERRRIEAVFVDGRQLVLLGAGTAELARESSDLPAQRLREAFLTHGYPCLAGGDPHRDEFRRWVEGAHGLPPGAEPLRARQRALEKDQKADVAELRAELARLGVVVRDERKRQYWRPGGPPG